MAEGSFERAIALIDAANALDPNVFVREDDTRRPKELAHAEMLTAWVMSLRPDASEEALLAARGQHIRRWEHPRSSFPEGRAGYLRWRTALYRFHADTTAALLREAGYGDEAVARVASLIRKEGLGTDPDAQVIEDGLCLVFLETQLAEFANRTDHEKMVNILRRTWRKMSPAARDEALKLAFAEPEHALIREALGEG